MGKAIKALIAGVMLGVASFVGGAVVADAPAEARSSAMPSCKDAQHQAVMSFFAALWYGEEIKRIDRRIWDTSVAMNAARGGRQQHLRGALSGLQSEKRRLVWQRETAIRNVHEYKRIAANCR